MRELHRFGGYFLTAVFLLVATAAWGQDPVQIDPQHFRIGFENDQVRVVRIHYGPREKSPTHTHPGSVEVSLTPERIRVATPDGFVRQEDWRAGEVEWDPSETHSIENLSDSALDTILVEIKGGLLALEGPSAGDALAADPGHYRFALGTGRFRVLRVHIEPHGRSAMHSHPGHLTIALTPYHIKFTPPSGQTGEKKGERGEISWFLPETHCVENLSDGPLELALIEVSGQSPKPRGRSNRNPSR